jgi:hypothetical protein
MEIQLFVIQELANYRGKGVDQDDVLLIWRSTTKGWFLDTVAQNHGINLQIFEKDADALK